MQPDFLLLTHVHQKLAISLETWIFSGTLPSCSVTITTCKSKIRLLKQQACRCKLGPHSPLLHAEAALQAESNSMYRTCRDHLTALLHGSRCLRHIPCDEPCYTIWLGSELHTITIANTTQPKLTSKLMMLPKLPNGYKVLSHVGCNVSVAPLHTYVLCMCTQTGLDVTLTWCYAGLAPKTPNCFAHADKQGKVLLACDTRPSGPALLAAAVAGVESLGGTAVQCGQLTTPQLHWQLRRFNQGLPWALQDYFHTLAAAFQQLVAGTAPLQQARLCTACCTSNGVDQTCSS